MRFPSKKLSACVNGMFGFLVLGDTIKHASVFLGLGALHEGSMCTHKFLDLTSSFLEHGDQFGIERLF